MQTGKITISDIENVRANLIIPLVVTTVCVIFDILFYFHLDKNDSGLYVACLWLFTAINSYYFPTLLSMSAMLLWQHYFSKEYSGIARKAPIMICIITAIFFSSLFFIFLSGIVYIELCFLCYHVLVMVFLFLNNWSHAFSREVQYNIIHSKELL